MYETLDEKNKFHATVKCLADYLRDTLVECPLYTTEILGE